MRKFLAVVRHEYRKVVLKWAFLIGTLLFPVLGLGFALVPALIFSLKGEPTRLAVVDPTGRIAPRLKANLSQEQIDSRSREAARHQVNDLGVTQDEKMKQGAKQMAAGIILIDYDARGKSRDQIRSELNLMAVDDAIDAYLIVPDNAADPDAKYEFLSRKAGDFVVSDLIKDALNEAVRSERLSEAKIDEAQLRAINHEVDLDTKSITQRGEEKDSESLFIASLVIGMMIYITLTIYGQVIMGAVVEEKETRIAEILFSSAKPMELMFGKLVGVGLAGLTQLAIWVTSLSMIVAVLSVQAGTAELLKGIPRVSPLMVVYFLLFFLVGYFIYASIFALIGASVTTPQEGGQFAFPAIMLLLIGFYFSFVVIRDPNSNLSFWVSIAPFFAPITMPVRILAETPPFWQILLAIGLNVMTICGLVWLAGRVYRVGMLMYGKRATISEIIKWARQP
ncbi:MAG: ABC transporter permease [Pyrinomonadaceae bacterium]